MLRTSNAISRKRTQFTRCRSTTIVEATAAGSPVVTIVDSYDPGNRKTSSARNGVVTTYTNDAKNRLLGQTVASGVATFSYATVIDSYDPSPRKITNSKQGEVATFTYGAKTRLVGQVLANGSATFVYDPVGNILTKWQQGNPPQTMTYDAASRMVTMLYGGAKTTYSYNQAGNKVLDSTGGAQTGYVYDGENRLLKLTNPMLQVLTNTYSGDGLRRTTQIYGGQVNTYVWDGTDCLGES